MADISNAPEIRKSNDPKYPCFEGFDSDISKHRRGGPCPHGRSSRSLGPIKGIAGTVLVVPQGRDDTRIVQHRITVKQYNTRL